MTSARLVMAGIYKTMSIEGHSLEVMTTELVTPANGQHTDNGRPKGFSSLTPFVALKDPRAALDFYTEVFSARVITSTEMGETSFMQNSISDVAVSSSALHRRRTT